MVNGNYHQYKYETRTGGGTNSNRSNYVSIFPHLHNNRGSFIISLSTQQLSSSEREREKEECFVVDREQ